MKDFCIVGSGIAGSTIASLLSKKYSIEIFDKARGPGGRCSNRRYKDNQSFDHGLQYIAPKSNAFTKFILDLKRKKIIKEWPGNHLDFNLAVFTQLLPVLHEHPLLIVGYLSICN